jgi:multifunctional beta-oxidation protein
LASRGAKIIVNDLGPSAEDKSKKAAEVVVEQITKAGGEAIANFNSNLEGDKIIKQAIDKWGRIDILINNAGILRDKSFKSMSDQEWDAITAVHITGSYACAHAAWPHMRKQKYGRIINIASAAGIYGNFGQANYSAAKLAMVAFTKTLSFEGAKYNIFTNTIAPIAASQMLATIMPKETLDQLKPEFVAPLATYLCSASNEEVNGQLFESGAGFMAALRRQRSKGVVFKTDDSFTPAAVREKVNEIIDFESDAEYPDKVTDANHMDFLERAKAAKPNDQGEGAIKFDGQTVLITGAGAGLGKAYALMFGKLGANVVVNDFSEKAANAVVDEVKKAGGKAAPAIGSVEEGDKIVQAAVDAFGGLHAVVNNAGILRDKSFASLEDKDWHAVVNIHLRGTYKVCKAAWPIFLKQKYGRIVNTTSAVGIYGNFGQANYSTAKGGILGLTQTLAIEGQKNNILCNTIAPNAGTAMTSTIWPQEMVDAFKPDFIAPAVGYLVSEANTEHTKQLWEVSGGWIAAVRWQRTAGHAFSHGKELTPEQVGKKMDKIRDFNPETSVFPATNQEAMMEIMANIGAESQDEDDDDESSGGSDEYADKEDSDLVRDAKKQPPNTEEFEYAERDVILYNLGIGATAKELNYVYEGADEFQAIPTFGVVPMFSAMSTFPLDWLPDFSPAKLLHGEQSLRILKPIPTSGVLSSKAQLIECLDKGKAASVVIKTITSDSKGEPLFENVSTLFIRGSGGFGGKKQTTRKDETTAANKPPSKEPDAVLKQKTTTDQAALYRLSGDYNPLHVDPSFAKMGGFDQPILHGLASYGVSGRLLLQKFGPFNKIRRYSLAW